MWYLFYLTLNTLMLFWLILGQRKSSLVVFLSKRGMSSVVFLTKIISNSLNQVIRNNIIVKKTTEHILLFHKKTTKLDFLWPNMGQKKHKSINSGS